jgi:hypothetical protein
MKVSNGSDMVKDPQLPPQAKQPGQPPVPAVVIGKENPDAGDIGDKMVKRPFGEKDQFFIRIC